MPNLGVNCRTASLSFPPTILWFHTLSYGLHSSCHRFFIHFSSRRDHLRWESPLNMYFSHILTGRPPLFSAGSPQPMEPEQARGIIVDFEVRGTTPLEVVSVYSPSIVSDCILTSLRRSLKEGITTGQELFALPRFLVLEPTTSRDFSSSTSANIKFRSMPSSHSHHNLLVALQKKTSWCPSFRLLPTTSETPLLAEIADLQASGVVGRIE